MQGPATGGRACQAIFAAANVGTTAYVSLTIGNAALLSAFASPEQKERYLKHLLSGRFFGTMALTEPQAGSSPADIPPPPPRIRTAAIPSAPRTPSPPPPTHTLTASPPP